MTKAYITLLASESYVPGALTLAKTLKHLETKHDIVVLLDLTSISKESLKLVSEAFDLVIPINDKKLLAPVEAVASKLGRKELSITFSKMLLWNLDYDKLIYLDCDTLPLKLLDHLFEKYDDLVSTEVVASPDIGWPDIFNSGLMIVTPNKTVFDKLIEFSAASDSSFDGADQGLLNEFFHLQKNGNTWTRLPFVYNVTPSTNYQYLPALTRFSDEIHLVHFIGAQKPWHYKGADKDDFQKLWWAKFNSFYTEEATRIQLLSTVPGEGYNLDFKKLVNQWDEESPLPHLDTLSVTEANKIFPWERRDAVQPTRVFQPVSYSNEAGQKETGQKKAVKVALEGASPVLSSKSEPLKNSYHQFNGTTEFNADKSFEEVSKMPLKFLTKKKEDSKK